MLTETAVSQADVTSAAEMPGPVSRTDGWNEPSVAAALMTTSPASVNLMGIADEIDEDLRHAPPVTAPRRQVGRHRSLTEAA